MDFIEAYLTFLSIVALLVIPAAGYATFFAWRRVWRFHREHDLPGLMVVLAVISTIAFITSTYAGVLVLGRLAGRPFPVEVTLPLTGTAFVTGELIPVIIMGYLIWRDRQIGRE